MPRLSVILFATLVPALARAQDTPPPDPDDCGTFTPQVALAQQPVQRAPLSTARATTRRPTLRWSSCTDARVEVCADRDCTVVLSSADVSGESWTPSSDLTGNGNVYFWRVTNRSGTTLGGSSHVWEVHVPAVSASHSTAGGSVLDHDLDGLADIAVGDYNDKVGRGTYAGAVYVYEADNRNVASAVQTLPNPDQQPGSLFGAILSNAGDVNGDGFADLIVGANNAKDPSNVATGAAYLFFGGAGGFDPVAAVSHGTASSAFGYSVSGAGDVDGDGLGDLLVGAPATSNLAGAAYLFLGQAGLPSSLGTPAATLTGSGGAGTQFGINVAGVGDLNGDGYGDIAVGESYTSFWIGGHPAGKVFVWYGGPNGISGPGIELVSPDTVWKDGFGFSISEAADVDGDGYHDLVASAAGTDSLDGAVYVWYGGPSGVSTLGADLAIYPDAPTQDLFGYSVSAAGDIDGDGIDDIVVAEVFGDAEDGALYVYLSTGTGAIKVANPDASLADALGNQLVIVGDTDGDDRADFVVGADGAAWLFPSTGAAPVPADGVSLDPPSPGFGSVGR